MIITKGVNSFETVCFLDKTDKIIPYVNEANIGTTHYAFTDIEFDTKKVEPRSLIETSRVGAVTPSETPTIISKPFLLEKIEDEQSKFKVRDMKWKANIPYPKNIGRFFCLVDGRLSDFDIVGRELNINVIGDVLQIVPIVDRKDIRNDSSSVRAGYLRLQHGVVDYISGDKELKFIARSVTPSDFAGEEVNEIVSWGDTIVSSRRDGSAMYVGVVKNDVIVDGGHFKKSFSINDKTYFLADRVGTINLQGGELVFFKDVPVIQVKSGFKDLAMIENVKFLAPEEVTLSENSYHPLYECGFVRDGNMVEFKAVGGYGFIEVLIEGKKITMNDLECVTFERRPGTERLKVGVKILGVGDLRENIKPSNFKVSDFAADSGWEFVGVSDGYRMYQTTNKIHMSKGYKMGWIYVG